MTIEDQIIAIGGKLDALTTAVAAISAPAVDLSPVLTAIAGIAAQLDPAPVAEPASASTGSAPAGTAAS